MPNAFRRLPIAAEMHAFKTEVGRDQRFVTCRNAQNRAVVPHSQNGVFSANRTSKPLEELSFRKRHWMRVQGTGYREQGTLSTNASSQRTGTENAVNNY